MWVLMRNIPLVAWNEAFFANIVGSFGELVCLDEMTSSGQRFDVARVLVSSSLPWIPSRLVTITMGDEKIIVSVESEK